MPAMNPQTLTVVIAAYNEEAALPVFHPRLMKVLDGLDLAARALYVDDGNISLYYAEHKLLPGKTRAFVDFIIEQFAEQHLAARFNATL